MKLKKLTIIARPIEDVKKEWTQALKGKVSPIEPTGVIVFTSLSAIAKALSPARFELLGVILKQKPASIYALAKLVERDFKNIYSDIRLLVEIGLIELKLHDGKRNAARPVAKHRGFEVDLAA